jgi:tungstate transport system ATP-binding protein
MRILPLSLENAEVSRHGARLIGPISHCITEGGITIVMGPNGAGKSTLLRLMHGLERLSAGQADWARPRAVAHQQQAFVFQAPIMLRRTVAQNLSYPLRLAKMPRDQVHARVVEWASRIGLADKMQQMAPRLSAGEKQKLSLARALMTRPQVLFLDEPCANLDGRSTREIEGILLQEAEAGTRIIMATHDMGQARRLAQDVLFMRGGLLEEASAAAVFFAGPSSPHAARFLRGDIVE